jgi:serine/threonine-protein kinase
MTLVGTTVDRFRIVDQLGRGGMGDVYVAWDERLNRKVALKSIRHEHRLNPEARARFVREARMLSQLHHPNICQIHDFIEGTDADFLVLELIDGRSLSRAMRDGLSYKRKLHIAEQIAGVLVAAHEKGVIHRDLKPDNVMLMDGDVVKVLDFGLSRSLGEGAREVTLPVHALTRPAGHPLPAHEPGRERGDEATASHSDEAETVALNASAPSDPRNPRNSETSSVTTFGTIMGTIGHMSPEQARGELVTPASDLYTFGLILQELFTGTPAYPRDAEKMLLLARAQRGESEPLPLLDTDLGALIRRLQSLEPAARPSATEARDRLQWIAAKPARSRRKLLLAAAFLVLVAFSIAMSIQTMRARTAEATALREAARANREAEASKKVSDFLIGMFKVSDPGEARGSSVTARELLDSGATRIDKELKDQPEIRGRLMDTMGLVYTRLGLYREAEPLLRRGLTIRRTVLGNQHPDVATSLQNLAVLSWAQGRYAEAEGMFKEALAIREKAMPGSVDLAKSLNNLAIVYK